MKTGLVHGRFQPPHNGHIRYILSALERAEHVLVGICTPKICTKEESARSGYPCTQELNPFTYEERVGMITVALNEANIPSDRYSLLPFPSDYKNLDTIIPNDTVFLMSVTGESDEGKIAYIKNLGYGAETIYRIEEGAPRERSGKVREGAKTGDATWEDMVPKSVARYMREHNMLEKLSMLE